MTTAIYLFIFALVLAYLETQIEGKDGWAANLPTWRYNAVVKQAKHLVHASLQHRYRGKHLTGYHLAMFTLVILVLHMPLVYGYPFTFHNYSLLWSIYFLLIVMWDFLWFVINPFYSMGNFNKKKIWWHTLWIGRVPTDYIVGVALSLVVLLPYALIIGDLSIFADWFSYVIIFVSGTSITLALAPEAMHST
jgi:hypothetical protein